MITIYYKNIHSLDDLNLYYIHCNIADGIQLKETYKSEPSKYGFFYAKPCKNLVLKEGKF